MRRTAFALLLLFIAGTPMPSQAFWWGGPCFGGCAPWPGPPGGWAGPGRFVVVEGAPRPFWGAPGAFGPRRFRPIGWGWGRPVWWWREMRRRSLLARWHAAEAAAREESRPPPSGPRRFPGWAWRPRPVPPVSAPSRPGPTETVEAAKADAAAREEPAVAMLPPASPRSARAGATSVRRVLTAAMMIRPTPMPVSKAAPVARAALRAGEPHVGVREPRPAPAVLRRPVPAAPLPPVSPAGLRNRPADPSPAVPRAAPPPAAPPESTAPADVPVAPLD